MAPILVKVEVPDTSNVDPNVTGLLAPRVPTIVVLPETVTVDLKVAAPVAPIVPVKVAFVPVILLLNVTALEKVGEVEFTVNVPPPRVTPPLTVSEERVPIEVKFAAEVTLGKEVVDVDKRVPPDGRSTLVGPVAPSVIEYPPEVLKLPLRFKYLLLTENPVEPTVMLSAYNTPLTLLKVKLEEPANPVAPPLYCTCPPLPAGTEVYFGFTFLRAPAELL